MFVWLIKTWKSYSPAAPRAPSALALDPAAPAPSAGARQSVGRPQLVCWRGSRGPETSSGPGPGPFSAPLRPRPSGGCSVGWTPQTASDSPVNRHDWF